MRFTALSSEKKKRVEQYLCRSVPHAPLMTQVVKELNPTSSIKSDGLTGDYTTWQQRLQRTSILRQSTWGDGGVTPTWEDGGRNQAQAPNLVRGWLLLLSREDRGGHRVSWWQVLAHPRGLNPTAHHDVLGWHLCSSWGSQGGLNPAPVCCLLLL